MIYLLVAIVAVALWLARRRSERVPCTPDLEATHDQFHAHADLGSVEVNEGDAVLVHGAPSQVAFGEKRMMATTATVSRASWPRRLLVRVLGTSHVTDLYEVGFEG